MLIVTVSVWNSGASGKSLYATTQLEKATPEKQKWGKGNETKKEAE